MDDKNTAHVEQTEESHVDAEVKEKSSEDTVSYDHFKQVLDEKKKLRDKVKEFESAEKKRREEALIAEGKLKEMLELRESEANELKTRLQEIEERDLMASKMSAIVGALGTGIDDRWYSIISQYVNEVGLDGDGNIDNSSVSKIAESLKRTWPEMIKKPVVGVPSGGPTGSATISRNEWLKLSSQEMQKWKPDQIV